MKNKEPILEPTEVQELNVAEGIESEQEMQDWETTTDQQNF